MSPSQMAGGIRMNCKYYGNKNEEENIMEQVQSDDNQYAMKNGIIYVTPEPKNSFESWYDNELINTGGRF